MAVNPYSVSGASTSTGGTGLASGTSNSAVSEREDLANFISMITRDETPFMASIGKTKATAIFHEWQTDALAAPGNSRVEDGADYTEVAPDFGSGTGTPLDFNRAQGTNTTPDRTRFGNYTQINAKTVAVSGTKRAVDQAGVADEYAYQLKKRGTEMRRDIEMDLLSNNSANGSGQRRFGGYLSWIQHPIGTAVLGSPTGTVLYKNSSATNDVEAPSANAGTGSAGIQLGSGDGVASFELDDIDQVMQSIYEAGGKATTLMVSPRLRRTFSAKAQAAGGLLPGN